MRMTQTVATKRSSYGSISEDWSAMMQRKKLGAKQRRRSGALVVREPLRLW